MGRISRCAEATIMEMHKLRSNRAMTGKENSASPDEFHFLDMYSETLMRLDHPIFA